MPSIPDTWLLDTHIWIRVLNGDELLDRPAFVQLLNQAASGRCLRLSSISLWETSMLAAKGRLKLSRPVREWLELGLKMPGLKLLDLSAEIAADSCFLPGDFHGDPADRLIAASARCTGSTLITLDSSILEYASCGWLKALSPVSL